MINELKNYFDTYRYDTELPEDWVEIRVLLKKICDKLSLGSSDSMTLYNITSSPENFIIQSDYATLMSSLNEEISEVINIIHE